MALLESGENYLETILLLERKTGFVRSIDVATELNFTKASVSRAMSNLKKENFIVVNKDGQIILTASGKARAEEILDRHETLTKFLLDYLKVPQDIAEKDACRIEHVISTETFNGIKNIMKNN